MQRRGAKTGYKHVKRCRQWKDPLNYICCWRKCLQNYTLMSFPWSLNGNTETECCSDLFVNIFESDATTKAAGKLRRQQRSHGSVAKGQCFTIRQWVEKFEIVIRVYEQSPFDWFLMCSDKQELMINSLRINRNMRQISNDIQFFLLPKTTHQTQRI